MFKKFEKKIKNQAPREHGLSSAQAQAAAAAMARLDAQKKTPMSATERKARQQLQKDTTTAADVAKDAEVTFCKVKF